MPVFVREALIWHPNCSNDTAMFEIYLRREFSFISHAVLAWGALVLGAIAQDVPAGPVPTGNEDAVDGDTSTVPQSVDVAPSASDNEIANRLGRILDATGWFSPSQVSVDEGVVFITGTARDQEVKEWATNLAQRTEGAVAVVNQLEVKQPSFWDFDPAWQGMRRLWHESLAMLPFFLFGIIVFFLTWLAARLCAFLVRASMQRQISSSLLREVLARTLGCLVLLFGVYIVLRVSGLTRLALTVVGGTGILGLVIGIAFRDITENFLASIFLSMRRPFLTGDLVEIVNALGYVQRLTTRTTVLITLNGNHVEIPNSTVYKNTIRNFSTNKNRREDFTVGIGYDVAITEAQDVALQILREHPAVLKEPEPWALVDSLGSAAVVLRVYFWLDGSENSWLKVKSSVIRLVKRAFQDAGINMPDAAREVVFPKGVPVQLSREEATALASEQDDRNRTQRREELGKEVSEPAVTKAEGGLGSDADEIEDQARQSRHMEGENLLKHPVMDEPRPVHSTQ
jgi:small-conductance mechanosensitive channel